MCACVMCASYVKRVLAFLRVALEAFFSPQARDPSGAAREQTKMCIGHAKHAQVRASA